MLHMRRFLMVVLLAGFALAGSITPTFAAQPDKLSPANITQHWGGWHQQWGSHMARVDVAVAHVRYCPSTSCDVVYHVYDNVRVHVYFHYGGWSNIGPNRWIASYLLES